MLRKLHVWPLLPLVLAAGYLLGAQGSNLPRRGNPTRRCRSCCPTPSRRRRTPRQVPVTRPEQKKSSTTSPTSFSELKAPASSPAFEGPARKGGRMNGFDFYRDPLGADEADA